MTLIAMLSALFALFILMTLWRDQSILPRSTQHTLDDRALDDAILAYHLDWEVLRDEQFRFYLFVKRVNAIQRYAHLARVSQEEAEGAIDYILGNPDVLEKLRPVKKRPPLPSVEEGYLRELIRQGAVEAAEHHYQNLADVDLFSAQRAVGILEREMWLEEINDPDVSRLLERDQSDAIELARRRYHLSQKEAIQVVDELLKRA